ncbi:MAG: HigA family addiction module antitoxin [Pyrinomonadaceae bacterium]
MAMHNPPHPGEFITEVYMEPNHISGRELAVALGVSPSTLNRVLNCMSGISPAMALRLSKALGRSPESWLAMQSNYDLWHAKRGVKLDKISRLELKAA